MAFRRNALPSIQHFRDSFHLGESVVKMWTHPNPGAIRAVDAQRNNDVVFRESVYELFGGNALRTKGQEAGVICAAVWPKEFKICRIKCAFQSCNQRQNSLRNFRKADVAQ